MARHKAWLADGPTHKTTASGLLTAPTTHQEIRGSRTEQSASVTMWWPLRSQQRDVESTLGLPPTLGACTHLHNLQCSTLPACITLDVQETPTTAQVLNANVPDRPPRLVRVRSRRSPLDRLLDVTVVVHVDFEKVSSKVLRRRSTSLSTRLRNRHL